jgi:predicted alpha/beta superfamily hydrolase
MATKDSTDDLKRKRAAAIRRARDERERDIEKPKKAEPAAGVPDGATPAVPRSKGGSPNYVDFLDRQMKRSKTPSTQT